MASQMPYKIDVHSHYLYASKPQSNDRYTLNALPDRLHTRKHATNTATRNQTASLPFPTGARSNTSS